MKPPHPLCLVLLFLSQYLTSATPLLRRPIPHCNPPSTSPSSPHHVPAVFAECMRIINLIPSAGPLDPTIPVKWAADASFHPDFVLPARWKEREKGSDRSNLEDLKKAAIAVAADCVIRPPHLGGWVQVGW
ncbi:MAG: hypothetical protein LQ346_005826 [Caloplaca aetnensis]|nr:MAG: hypothetical protein LQ346_005826 [Caloplaca aetnensis]